MKRFEINKILLESPTPPKDINTLWIDIDENTKTISTIKEFINGEWKTILSKEGSSSKIPMLHVISEGSTTRYEEFDMPEGIYDVKTETFIKTYPIGFIMGNSSSLDDFIFYSTLAKVYNETVGNTINIVVTAMGISFMLSKTYDTSTHSWGEWVESPV